MRDFSAGCKPFRSSKTLAARSRRWALHFETNCERMPYSRHTSAALFAPLRISNTTCVLNSGLNFSRCLAMPALLS